MTRHFLEIDDLTADELGNVLDLSEQPIDVLPKVLAGKGVAVLFEKPSARTRNSVEMAVAAPPESMMPEVSDELAEAAEKFGLSTLEAAAYDRLGVSLV